MSVESKSRAVLRPAGNVARHESRGATNPGKLPTKKKPPASPPLKPSPALSTIKISPPNSLPTTPKSPVLSKCRSMPRLTQTKLLSPVKAVDPAHVDPLLHRRTSPPPPPPPSHSQASPASFDIPTSALLQSHLSLNPSSASLDNSSVIDQVFEQTMRTTLSTSDNVKERMSASSNDARIFTKDVHIDNAVDTDSCHAPLVVPLTKTISASPSQKTVTRYSSLSRSTSDNFHRRHAKANGSNSPRHVPIGCHSLDDSSLTQLVAAKKAAACEMSVQRRLKVSEYGRKPGKASRVAPDVPSLVSVNAEPQRCKFITAQSDPLYVAYHDQEWGVPVHDDRSLFELLVLAGAQVELSWTTILHKRELYRTAFSGYDPAVVASFKEKHIQSLEADKNLLLQGAKIRGVVENARRVLDVVQEFGSLDTYLWSFLNYKPMINDYRYPKQLPAKTSKSEFISKDLVRRGFRFVGPTIVYSFMQAAGMANDHLVQCFRHKACMTQMGALQDNIDCSFEDKSDGIKVAVSQGVGYEEESDSSVSHVHALQVDDSMSLLHELDLQTHNLGQQYAHSDFVYIEAY